MSSRPAIPQGPPPRYMLFARSAKSLRPVVMVMAISAAIWSLLWGASSFMDIDDDGVNGFGELLPYSIALGIVFIVAGLIEVFGVYAASKQQVRLVRLYCWGSILASVLALGAEVIIIVVQFIFKKKYYDTCFDANNGARIPRGWWGESRPLNPDQARDFCNELIRKRITIDFVWLVISAILAALFVSVNFSYYRQILDPSWSRAPSNQVRMQAFTVQPPYGYPQQPAYPGYQGGFGANNEPALPVYEGSKLPDYDGSGRQSPEKIDDISYTSQQFAAPAGPPPQSFAPPPGPPPAPGAPKPTNPFERRAEDP